MSSMSRLIEDVLGAPPARGRRRMEPLQATIERQLDRADIDALWNEKPGQGGVDAAPQPGPSQSVSPIQRLRTSHHMLAKLIAEGRKGQEISLITGYSVTYISNIQKDPSFADLVGYYKSQLGEVYLNVHQRLSALGMDIVDELQTRLNESPDDFSLKDLEEIAKMALDRAGYGPQSTVNHKGAVALVTPDHLARIKDEVARNETGRVTPLLSPDNQQAPMGPLIEHEPVAESKADGDAGEGNNLPEQSGEAGPGSSG